MGVKISVGVGLAGCVTNALDNGVGVAVAIGVGGADVTSVEMNSVGVVPVSGNSINEFPPMGVGVWYCPHKVELLPPHEESIKVVRVEIMSMRFTVGIIPVSMKNPLNTKDTKCTKFG